MECKYRPVERMGLYIMVALILLQTCSLDTKRIEKQIEEVNRKLDKIESIIAR